MANYHQKAPGFRLAPFFQNKANAVSFFLISPYHDKTVLNFFIEMEDYLKPEAFFEMLSVAVDSIMLQNAQIYKKSEPAVMKHTPKKIL